MALKPVKKLSLSFSETADSHTVVSRQNELRTFTGEGVPLQWISRLVGSLIVLLLSGETSDEFFVSSSARPFQGSSSQFFPSSSRYPIFKTAEGKTPGSQEPPGAADFITPDSGVEDSTPQRKPDEEDIPNVLDNLKFNFIGGKSGDGKPASDAFGEDSSSSNDVPSNNSPISPLSPVALGELRHARNKLKLDLPLSHNVDLNMSLGKGINNKLEELTQN